VQDYLRANLSRNITVDQLAAVCGLSAGHFTYAFTETFRQSPYKYILNLRLATAEKMLVETDLKISEVAYLTGFSSQSHLTTAMRRHKHTTPAKLRQKK
jgi:AraC family transcriptional regulator